MVKLPSKKITSYLESNHQDLRFLLTKIKTLTALNDKIKNYLDLHLRDYCQVANLVNQNLILMVANSSIATQLRFQTPDLLKKFKSDPMLATIKEIQCKVRPFSAIVPAKARLNTKKMPLLSPETAEIILHIASLLEDDQLREVMERIAGRVNK